MDGRKYSRTPWRLGEILVQQEMITWEDLAETLDLQKSRKELLGQLLIERNLIDEDQLSKGLAAQCGVDFIYLTHCAIPQKALEAVPKSFVQQFQFMPINIDENCFTIAVANPFNLFLTALLTEITRRPDIKIVVAGPGDIRATIHEYYDPPCLQAS